MLAVVLRLAVVLGVAGAALLWAAGVFALSIGVWQWAGLALLLAAGLSAAAFVAHRVRRGLARDGRV